MKRRDLWKLAPLALAPAASPAENANAPTDSFPTHPLELAREMVGVSHSNLKRVKELTEARPTLARAAVDWGFGDWEDALGAASHVGNREIAEYLISRGARRTLFSATMLGQLEVVKAFVAAQPGVQRIPGPHSLTLLSHAKAGGKQAEAVYQYLESLGDAGAPAPATLSAEEFATLAGVYVFGSKPNERIEIAEKRGLFFFIRQGASASGNRLTYLGDRAFHPAGARDVRIRFTGEGANMVLTVHDPDVVVTAKRLQQPLK